MTDSRDTVTLPRETAEELLDAVNYLVELSVKDGLALMAIAASRMAGELTRALEGK